MNSLRKIFVGAVLLGTSATLFAADNSGIADTAGKAAGIGIGIVLLYSALALTVIIGVWKVFTKAGKPGWAILIPIYNTIVMLEIARRPIWWLILLFIPIVGAIVSIIITIDIAKAFGKGAGFGLGLVFLPMIFYPVLGFGKSQYSRL